MRNRIAAAAIAAGGVALSFGLVGMPAAVFAGLLFILAIYIAIADLERFIIPDLANAMLFALGLCLVVTEAWPDDRLAAVADAVLRSITAGGLFLLLRYAHARLSGAVGLGLGDVKLAAAGAPFLAWTTLPLAVLLAATAGIVAVLIRAALTRTVPGRQTELPFGAFLAPAVWVCFVGERIWFAAN